MTNQLKPWHFKQLPLQKRTGGEIFSCLFISDSSKIATLLESPYPNNLNNPQLTRYSICAGSPRIIDGVEQMWPPQLGEVQDVLNRLLARKLNKTTDFNSSPYLPFTGGWLGWLGYDVAWETETLPKLKTDNLPFPVAFWYEPECFAVLDHQEQFLYLAASNRKQLD